MTRVGEQPPSMPAIPIKLTLEGRTRTLPWRDEDYWTWYYEGQWPEKDGILKSDAIAYFWGYRLRFPDGSPVPYPGFYVDLTKARRSQKLFNVSPNDIVEANHAKFGRAHEIV